MSWLLRMIARGCLLLCCALMVSEVDPGVALADYGGGYGGSNGDAIWALSWWTGNPQGPGPYIGPSADAASQCMWHDTGGSVADLGLALGESSLPSSFWTAPQGGGHPGIWGVLLWANRVSRAASPSDHFDVVACPDLSQIPAPAADLETDLPRAHPPGGKPLYVWIFWDTVADPPPTGLPPVVNDAFQMVHLPAPVINTSPSTVHGTPHATAVNLPTWLWIDPSIWRTWAATAIAGPVVATVWAEPVSVSWSSHWDFTAPAEDPEHGTTNGPEVLAQTCEGPGIPYRYPPPPGAEAAACTATFTQSSLGTWQPLTATVEWIVRWAVSGPTGVVGGEGFLPRVTTASSSPIRAMQIESIIATG